MENRIDYLIECSKTARDELLFRVKHRDNWLKLQLYIQAVLWALANGIKLTTEAEFPVPKALALSLPISLVFVCLYYVEDGLISKLSKYVGSLSDLEMKISKNGTQIKSWDNSSQLQEYATGDTLKIRILAQIAGFLILPGYLGVLNFTIQSYECWQVTFQIVLFLVIALIIAYFIRKGYKQRKTTGKID